MGDMAHGGYESYVTGRMLGGADFFSLFGRQLSGPQSKSCTTSRFFTLTPKGLIVHYRQSIYGRVEVNAVMWNL